MTFWHKQSFVIWTFLTFSLAPKIAHHVKPSHKTSANLTRLQELGWSCYKLIYDSICYKAIKHRRLVCTSTYHESVDCESPHSEPSRKFECSINVCRRPWSECTRSTASRWNKQKKCLIIQPSHELPPTPAPRITIFRFRLAHIKAQNVVMRFPPARTFFTRR